MAAAETTSQCEIDGRPGDDPPAQAAASAAGAAPPRRVVTVAAPRWNVAAASGVQDRWWVLLAVLLVFFLEWIDRFNMLRQIHLLFDLFKCRSFIIMHIGCFIQRNVFIFL